MTKTRMTVTIVLSILAIIWIVRQIDDFAGRVVLEKEDFVNIVGETWIVRKSPSFTSGWFRHQLANSNGQKMTIHVVEMGRLFRSGEAKLICRKGDPKWKEIAEGFAIASH